ncbi:uncharacterized protein LOC144579723 isoform X1 [Callithrix jacchus]
MGNLERNRLWERGEGLGKEGGVQPEERRVKQLARAGGRGCAQTEWGRGWQERGELQARGGGCWKEAPANAGRGTSEEAAKKDWSCSSARQWTRGAATTSPWQPAEGKRSPRERKAGEVKNKECSRYDSYLGEVEERIDKADFMGELEKQEAGLQEVICGKQMENAEKWFAKNCIRLQ